MSVLVGLLFLMLALLGAGYVVVDTANGGTALVKLQAGYMRLTRPTPCHCPDCPCGPGCACGKCGCDKCARP
jgi:hypothetical protein